jgi:3-methyladenine DNA glycosylase AlkD
MTSPGNTYLYFSETGSFYYQTYSSAARKMENIIDNIRSDLRLNSNEKDRVSGERFFKEEIRLYGMKAALIRQIAGKWWKEVQNLSKKEIFGLCEELWASGYLEEAGIAIEWVIHLGKKVSGEDFRLFERWLSEYVTNWASCDGFCNHPVGDLVMKYPELLEELKKWTGSPNRWVRRGSAVSLIVPARRGLFLRDIFEIAELLLTDSDDMVQKGYGWMLKAASEAHRDEVFNFVISHKNAMPRTALRYAIEKMPEDLRKRAMARD